MPAEVLALSGFMTGILTTTTVTGDKSSITFDDPNFTRVGFWVLVVLAPAIYIVGRKVANGTLDRWDWVRAAIPAGAFVSWGMLNKGTGFELWFPSFQDDSRAVTAAFAAIVLGLLATLLGFKVNADEKKA